jgi:hypothetical protein
VVLDWIEQVEPAQIEKCEGYIPKSVLEALYKRLEQFEDEKNPKSH